MLIKTFKERQETRLDKAVNRFLTDNSIEVVSIKFTSTTSNKITYLYAMVIYKEEYNG